MARQKKERIVEEIEKFKCTSCGAEQDIKEFAPSFSFVNKNTKRLTICKSCCSELFDRNMVKYQDEMLALYRLCMELDLPFIKNLANTILSKNKNSDKNLGFLYLSKMGLVQYRNKTFENDMVFLNIFGINEEELHDLMYVNAEKNKEEIMKKQENIITPEVIKRWGKDLEIEDYIFLEDRYSVMLNSYDDKNPSSIWTYQEICYNYLLLRKERGNPSSQKNLQEMISRLQSDCKMKLSQVDSSEDESACIGKFIDKVENYEPCDKKLPFFEDIDGIKKYIKKWFVQPFAREHGIASKEVLQGEEVEDYTDLNTIYKEEKEDFVENILNEVEESFNDSDEESVDDDN